MSIPALIFRDASGFALRVAGVTLLDRVVVAAHRAGCAPISLVGSSPLPRLDRSRALGITITTPATPPESDGAALVVRQPLLVLPADLRRLSEHRGRLTNAGRTPLPAAVLSPADYDNESAWAQLPPVAAIGPALEVADRAQAVQAEAALWRSITSASDGFVDRHVNRPLGRFLSKVLVHTPITPNQVSIASILLGLYSAWLFASGDAATMIAAALMLQVSAIVDCVDGDLARVLFKESRLGKWLDLGGDQVVHISVFACLGVGLARAGSQAPVAVLGFLAAAGVLIAFLVVLHGLHGSRARPGGGTLQRLVNATTNRDFSVLLTLLACVQRLEWFLWLAAAGVHVFWVTALCLQLRGTRRQPTHAPSA